MIFYARPFEEQKLWSDGNFDSSSNLCLRFIQRKFSIVYISVIVHCLNNAFDSIINCTIERWRDHHQSDPI